MDEVDDRTETKKEQIKTNVVVKLKEKLIHNSA